MTKTQWAFEFHALQAKEKLWFESAFHALRQTLVGVLGLNSIKPEDENGKPKDWDKMSDDEKESFLPLVAWVGRPEILKIAAEQMEQVIDDDKVVGDKQYEALVAEIDAAGGDMDPILGIDKLDIPKNPARDHQKKALNIMDRSELDIDVGDV